jgi:hypothetical protein
VELQPPGGAARDWMDRYASSRPGRSQDWKAKAGASSPAHWHEMIRDLSFGNPLIAGLKNDDDSLHAVVVTAITYRRRWDGAPAYESVVIRDPWPYNTSFQELAWREFVGRATFLIRSHISFPTRSLRGNAVTHSLKSEEGLGNRDPLQ